MLSLTDKLNKKYKTNIPYIAEADEFDSRLVWEEKGRPRLKRLLQSEEYGAFPDYDKKNTVFNIKADGQTALKDIWRKEIEITVNHGGKSHTFTAYMFTPSGCVNVPVFLYINRWSWVKRSTISGTAAQRFPLEEIIKRGYGVIFFSTDDIASEMLDTGIDYKKGLHDALGIDANAPDNLGAIGLWAFAAMRVMDYLETDKHADASKVAVVGHSRLGKTALLCGAMDERFALTVSNDSGAGGAALFKTKQGEHVDYMVDTIPYWFCNNYRKYYKAENKMEFDQHFLLSLVAPRPLYIASAALDDWADPEAEFLSALLCSEIYEKIYGRKGLGGEMPRVDTPLSDGYVGYHVRSGGHEILKYDWERFMDFADKHFDRFPKKE